MKNGMVFCFFFRRMVASTSLLLGVHGLASSAHANSGAVVAGIGDVDHDGAPDIAFSNNSQSIFVFSGVDGTFLLELKNPTPSDGGFGCAFAGVGDIDADGTHDIAVGSGNNGEILFFSGSLGTLVHVRQADVHEQESCSLPDVPTHHGETLVGDIDGDSILDLAFVAHGNAFVFSGADATQLLALTPPKSPTGATLTMSGIDTRSTPKADCFLRTRFVKSGDWRTLESFLTSRGTAFFRLPIGGRIKVRYGVGWLGKDRQKQTLDGSAYKKLEVGSWSVTRARMQIRVSSNINVEYLVCPGGVGLDLPEIRF